jgi:hypothetical protein
MVKKQFMLWNQLAWDRAQWQYLFFFQRERNLTQGHTRRSFDISRILVRALTGNDSERMTFRWIIGRWVVLALQRVHLRGLVLELYVFCRNSVN